MSLLYRIEDYILNNNIEQAYNLIIETESQYIENADYWNIRGVLCMKVGELTTAKSCLERSLEINSGNGDVYYNYATVLERMGNQSDAALYYGLAFRNSNDLNLKEELEDVYKNQDALRNIFNTASIGQEKSFIILSSCAWGDIYQRMHHIARSLVKFGHDVIYVAPSVTLDISTNTFTKEELVQYSINSVKWVDGVKIYTPISILKENKMIYGNYLELTQRLLDSVRLKQKVLLSYMPYQVNIINSLTGDFFHIYDCVDDHSDLEYAFWGNTKDVIWEQQLMDKANAITTTATSLFLQRFAIEGRKNVYISKNAVNEDDFILSEEYDTIPTDIKDIPQPRIVFTGVVYERFDEKLFYELVESNPDKSFVIIGPVHEGLLKRKFSNLYLLGPKPHSELTTYLKHMQIGIVPYIDNADMDIACDSIKQYEYIACELPVITTYMPESGINKIYTFLADSKEKFNEAIENCLSLRLDAEIIGDFLAANSWNERAALLCRIAENKVSEKETLDNIEYIGNSIDYLVDNFNSASFLTLKGIYESLYSCDYFEMYTKQAYEIENIKFIEKYYLVALFKNNNIETFINVVQKSKFISNEIKTELLYRMEKKDFECVRAISYYCVNDIKACLEWIPKLNNDFDKTLYTTYLEFILNKSIPNGNNFWNMDKQELSPLYSFLKKVVI